MSNPTPASRALAVPSGRVARAVRLGSMATRVAAGAAMHAAGDLSRGQRPSWQGALMTPGNLRRLTEELSRMRGAAMKLGQILSMDTGEVLPPELAEILARLRNDAHFMPPKQLRAVLDASWGPGWMRSFRRFDTRPLAAASIGQVHRAALRDGRSLAIKVQYPGVARSIDSDVANVGALIRLSGLLPKGFDLAPYLEEAQAQLHEETDYLAEGAHLARFSSRLAHTDFVLPEFHADWSARNILAMSFVEGGPIEAASDLDQQTRDRVATDLIALFLRELFEFHELQSDPNFANYRYNAATGRIVLLDFGATRAVAPWVAASYTALLRGGLDQDTGAIEAAATLLGLLRAEDAPQHKSRILAMINITLTSLFAQSSFDFANPDFSAEVQAQGLALHQAGYVPQPVPMDVLYVQRKLAGLFLLAGRLKASVPVRAMIENAVSAAPVASKRC